MMGDLKSQTDAELDRSWDEFKVGDGKLCDGHVRVKCVRVDLRKHKGRESIVFTCVELNGPNREIAVWFNVLPVKGKNDRRECKMGKNSKLAKLYRVTIGSEPSHFSRARMCAKRLVGKEFYVKPAIKKDRDWESSDITPVDSIKSEFWSAAGKFYQNPCQAKQQNNGRLKDSHRTSGGQLGDTLRTSDSRLEHQVKGSQRNSTTTNQLTHNKSPTASTHHLASDVETKTIGINKTSRYFRRDGEPICDYYDRVINESGFLD